MRLRAEVHCYHCGQVSGTWEWPAALSPDRGLFRPSGGGEGVVALLRGARCAHCHGPIFLDEVGPIVERPPLVLERTGRGRPRRAS